MHSRLKATALSLTVLSALVLGGCSSAGTAGDSKTVSILISSNGAAEDGAWKDLIADFKKEDPDITVKFESLASTDYATVLKTRVLGGAGPDVFKYDGNTASQFIDAGYTMDVSKESYFTGLTQSVQDQMKRDAPVEGSAFSVPVARSGNGIVYNTALFKAAGIDTLPTTYDEFVDACKKLLASGTIPIAMSAQDNWWPQFILYYAAAQNVFSENPDFNKDVIAGKETYAGNAGWKRTMEIFKELAPYYMPNPLGTDQAAAQAAFLQGNAAMFPAPWIMPEVRKTDLDVGYFNFPTTDDPDEKSMWGASLFSLAVNPANGNKVSAGKFLDFLFSEGEYAKFLNAINSFPTVDGVEVSATEPMNPIMLDAWKGKTFVPTFTPPGGAVQEAMLPAVQDLLADKKTVQQVLEALDAAVAGSK